MKRYLFIIFQQLKITRKIFLTVQIFLTGNWKLLETIHTNIDLIFFNYFIFDNSDKSHREIFHFVKKNILFAKKKIIKFINLIKLMLKADNNNFYIQH